MLFSDLPSIRFPIGAWAILGRTTSLRSICPLASTSSSSLWCTSSLRPKLRRDWPSVPFVSWILRGRWVHVKKVEKDTPKIRKVINNCNWNTWKEVERCGMMYSVNCKLLWCGVNLGSLGGLNPVYSSIWDWFSWWRWTQISSKVCPRI